MNMRFYQKMAWSGMKKNGRLYIPYLLTCVGMVMMSYILQSLGCCLLLENMRGGGDIKVALNLGKFVVAVFALIFLIYTNSFLVRRRNREFGLYHILGMDKKGICRIIFWESLMTACIGLIGGLVLGVAFSKLAELILANILHRSAGYSFTLKWEAFRWVFIIYGIIFSLLLGNALIGVQRTKTLELLKSENLGEKPPKGNLFIALIGALLLAGAYYMAVTIKSPLSAMMLFFVAVIMVIIATYLLFIAGSVVLCKLLQKNKKYYYKKNHFVSVSSMTYRMKRNGAGLASICILSTMVLVMLSSTGSLYFGMNKTIDSRYPREITIEPYVPHIVDLTEENMEKIRAGYERVLTAHHAKAENVVAYPYAILIGVMTEDGLKLHDDPVNGNDMDIINLLREVMFVEAADYNKVTGENVELRDDEVCVLPIRCDYEQNELVMNDVKFSVKGTVDGEFTICNDIPTSVVPALVVIVSDLSQIAPLEQYQYVYGTSVLSTSYCYAYDLPETSGEEIVAIFREQQETLGEHGFLNDDGLSYYATCKTQEREEFVGTFGGMFFLGLVLSVIFIFATVLIIYYKQISEGYEDQSRFEIMTKVGMTKEDIRKSINSQILTVFFAPLLLAGVHLVFAYPLIWKILQLFFMRDLFFVILVTVGIYLVFGIAYAFVYKLTAGAYYRIVSGEGAR